MSAHSSRHDRLAAARQLIDLITLRLSVNDHPAGFALECGMIDAMISQAQEFTRTWFDLRHPEGTESAGLLPLMSTESIERIVEPAVDSLLLAGELVARYSATLEGVWSPKFTNPPQTQAVREFGMQASRLLTQIVDTAKPMVRAATECTAVYMKRLYIGLAQQLADIGVQICTSPSNQIYRIPLAQILLTMRAQLHRHLADIELKLAEGDSQAASKLI